MIQPTADWRVDVFQDFATELAVTQRHTADAVARTLVGEPLDVDLTALSRELTTLADIADSLDMQPLKHQLECVAEQVNRARRAGTMSEEAARTLFHLGVSLDRSARDLAIGLSKSSEIIPPRPIRNPANDHPTALLLEHAGRAALEAGQRLRRHVRIRIAPHPSSMPSCLLPVLHRVLLQLVRNAVCHGIESPSERLAAGKPAAGMLDLSATVRGNTVQVLVTDDGRGVNAARVGLDPVCDGRELFRRLAEPGITMCPCEPHRGLGLTGVQHTMTRLRGHADVTTWPGRGSRFRLTIPVEVSTPQR